jgi:hypothetical protein
MSHLPRIVAPAIVGAEGQGWTGAWQPHAEAIRRSAAYTSTKRTSECSVRFLGRFPRRGLLGLSFGRIWPGRCRRQRHGRDHQYRIGRYPHARRLRPVTLTSCRP